ncbi:repressor LexA [Microcoleus sp. FACHB-1515]|uniref:transcriptional repressor LexA n=1 Tax=Cyanophyceae TaxID=3028117 RepID=UPI001683A6D0|nr:transcriptional repressor LexA [Microcoleus sp. FACHB-1515]MBD2089881.1 repressor LexA [Microcoleus sp. FACHB-1515]
MNLELHMPLFHFIENYQKAYGNTPTIEEMMRATGKGHGTVQNSLKRLEEAGYLRRHSHKKSHIEILKPSRLGVPIRGEIAAGYLSDACINTTDYLIFSAPWLEETDFALKVSGDSMSGDAIANGAFVIMRAVPNGYQPKQGEIVAAWVEGFGTTLKRFYRQGDLVTLQASNPAYEPIQLNLREHELQIQGIWISTLHGRANLLTSS